MKDFRTISFYGYPAGSYPFGSDRYLFEHYAKLFPAMVANLGWYRPLFGEVDTVDGKPIPGVLREPGIFYHVEFGAPDEELFGEEVDFAVELEVDLSGFNVRAMRERWHLIEEMNPPYSQPLLPILLNFAARTRHFWFLRADYDYRWEIGLGLEVKAPRALQFNSRVFAPLDRKHFDWREPEFWSRAFDCSSLVLWILLWGLAEGRRPFIHDRLSPEVVNAVDSVSPGMVFWILEKAGMVRSRRLHRPGGRRREGFGLIEASEREGSSA